MKKILSLFTLVAVCLMMASCQSETDKKIKEMNEAVEGKMTAKVEETASALYGQKSELSADNLVDLTIAYTFLAESELAGRNDASCLADYIEKAIDCRAAASELEPEKCQEMFANKGKADLNQRLNELKSLQDKAKAAEQALLDQINS